MGYFVFAGWAAVRPHRTATLKLAGVRRASRARRAACPIRRAAPPRLRPCSRRDSSRRAWCSCCAAGRGTTRPRAPHAAARRGGTSRYAAPAPDSTRRPTRHRRNTSPDSLRSSSSSFPTHAPLHHRYLIYNHSAALGPSGVGSAQAAELGCMFVAGHVPSRARVNDRTSWRPTACRSCTFSVTATSSLS